MYGSFPLAIIVFVTFSVTIRATTPPPAKFYCMERNWMCVVAKSSEVASYQNQSFTFSDSRNCLYVGRKWRAQTCNYQQTADKCIENCWSDYACVKTKTQCNGQTLLYRFNSDCAEEHTLYNVKTYYPNDDQDFVPVDPKMCQDLLNNTAYGYPE